MSFLFELVLLVGAVPRPMTRRPAVGALDKGAALNVVTEHPTLEAAYALVGVGTVFDSVIRFVAFPALHFDCWTLGCHVISLLAGSARLHRAVACEVITFAHFTNFRLSLAQFAISGRVGCRLASLAGDIWTEVDVVIAAALDANRLRVDDGASDGGVPKLLANFARLNWAVTVLVSALAVFTLVKLVNQRTGMFRMASFVANFADNGWARFERRLGLAISGHVISFVATVARLGRTKADVVISLAKVAHDVLGAVAVGRRVKLGQAFLASVQSAEENMMASFAPVANVILVLLRADAYKVADPVAFLARLAQAFSRAMGFVAKLTGDVDRVHLAVRSHMIDFVTPVARNCRALHDVVIASAFGTNKVLHVIVSAIVVVVLLSVRLLPELGQHVLYVLCLFRLFLLLLPSCRLHGGLVQERVMVSPAAFNETLWVLSAVGIAVSKLEAVLTGLSGLGN